jgi:pimeloyl-ACP methyl ester carboxylesterase
MNSVIDLDWNGPPTQLEIAWVGSLDLSAPVMVFLHEGLGSVSLWRDYPDQLCQELNMRGLVYSRPGYGKSTPRKPQEKWGVDFMHQQAHAVLPALLKQLDIHQPWLFGHSDGGSIALLYAAHFPKHLAGAIVLAPHIMVEEISIASIQAARTAYEEQGLRERLMRHHNNPDSAFYGWNTIWLDPAFRTWNITAELSTIQCPLFAIQGVEDEYGSMQQIYGIRDQVPHTTLLELPACGHSPHKDQPLVLNNAVKAFITSHNAQH